MIDQLTAAAESFDQDAPPGPASHKPSRFNMIAWQQFDSEDRVLLVYNSLTGAFMRFGQDIAEQVMRMLTGPPFQISASDTISPDLVRQGLLVPGTLDEAAIGQELQDVFKTRQDTLNLIIMPTERCNFRCVYCYEDLVKGKMGAEIRSGIENLVENEAAHLRSLAVDWFGGEPLAALDVIEDLSARLMRFCAREGVEYSASMTTNGYLLDEKAAARCRAAKIERYQITIDGPPDTHDQLRMLADGSGTFDTIARNLVRLRASDAQFNVRLRVNYTPAVARRMPAFLGWLGDNFGNDSRFTVWFHPVGHWGGPHDEEVEACDQHEADELELAFTKDSMAVGFLPDAWTQSMRPFGSVCYAADPRSYVIGSDGTIYKCTVALREASNVVGKLSADGQMNLSRERLDLWVSSGAEADKGCQACAFRPACQGNACPLERMRQGGLAPCPPVKRRIGPILTILANDAGAGSCCGTEPQ